MWLRHRWSAGKISYICKWFCFSFSFSFEIQLTLKASLFITVSTKRIALTLTQAILSLPLSHLAFSSSIMLCMLTAWQPMAERPNKTTRIIYFEEIIFALLSQLSVSYSTTSQTWNTWAVVSVKWQLQIIIKFLLSTFFILNIKQTRNNSQPLTENATKNQSISGSHSEIHCQWWMWTKLQCNAAGVLANWNDRHGPALTVDGRSFVRSVNRSAS